MSKESRHVVHLAGIIPVANLNAGIDTAFPEVLLPLGDGYSAIQKSVYECALAGCNTIWIIANDDLAPLVRKVVGEWVYDPVYYKRDKVKFYKELRKEIPIYYVPIHPKDRNRRDCYSWSVLHGVNSAWKVSVHLSKWITPTKYYISFPLTTYNLDTIRENRLSISKKDKNFYLSYNNKTVKDNLPIAFTLTGDDFIQCRRNLNKMTTREYLPPLPGQQYPQGKLPLTERWSARTFTLETVFAPLNSDKATVVPVDWHYDISTWIGYREYMEDKGNSLRPPYSELIRSRKHAPIIAYTPLKPGLSEKDLLRLREEELTKVEKEAKRLKSQIKRMKKNRKGLTIS